MKYIGHRGYRKRYLENTLPGFQAVIEYSKQNPSVIGIELDIHLTADSRLIVLHDTTVSLGKRKVSVCDLSFAQVRAAVLDRNDRPDGPVPTLDETLALVNHQVGLYLEIKDAPYDRTRFGDELSRLLRAYKPKKDIVLHSFSAEMVERAMDSARGMDVEYGFLFTQTDAAEALAPALKSRLNYYHPHYSLLLREAGKILDWGLPLNTWTVNSKAVLRKLKQLPPDRMRSIMTDNLALSESEEEKHG